VSIAALLRAVAVTLLLGATAWLLPVTEVAALAHTEIERTTPADGARLTSPPRQITLTFGEPVRQSGAGLAVAGPAGHTALHPEVAGPVVSARWPASLEEGAFEVDYRVVAEDGHVADGDFSFTIVAAPAKATVTPSSAASAASNASEPAPGGASGVPGWLWIVGALILAAVVLGFLRMSRSHDRP
jgi:copper resistance protein C